MTWHDEIFLNKEYIYAKFYANVFLLALTREVIDDAKYLKPFLTLNFYKVYIRNYTNIFHKNYSMYSFKMYSIML